jgi:hypothetical protein
MLAFVQDAVSEDGFFVTVSTDINMAPNNIVASAYLCNQFCTDTPYSCFSGFSGFTTVDSSGTPSQTDLSQTFFNSAPLIIANNVITVTFVNGCIAAGASGWPVSSDNFLQITSACQIIFSQGI